MHYPVYMNMDNIHVIESLLSKLLSLVNDFDVDTEQQDEYIDMVHMHLNDASRYLNYLIMESDE